MSVVKGSKFDEGIETRTPSDFSRRQHRFWDRRRILAWCKRKRNNVKSTETTVSLHGSLTFAMGEVGGVQSNWPDRSYLWCICCGWTGQEVRCILVSLQKWEGQCRAWAEGGEHLRWTLEAGGGDEVRSGWRSPCCLWCAQCERRSSREAVQEYRSLQHCGALCIVSAGRDTYGSGFFGGIGRKRCQQLWMTDKLVFFEVCYFSAAVKEM